MPAMLDDPDAPTIYRTSGAHPYPDPENTQPALPAEIFPRQVILRDRVTVATLLPFSSYHLVPDSLLKYLCDQLNKEIEGGDTYPMVNPLSYEKFNSYWFQNFAAVMLLGNVEHLHEVGQDWSKLCLGSFYIKPNYPGRSSHVCNAGFLVTDASRNRGVGRLMGETYIDWAPKLGYTYSVFNLVYETNVASCRIWDALGFKRIGRVKGCGNLKSYPDHLVDAIIYGRDLGPEGEDLVSEERFDKIKFYLKFSKYPNGADRAEKSRLRSAATHYKLLDDDKLMLKDKEVISDPKQQYEIARKIHVAQHGGINKTTATIAESYHWIRIKETVSLVIKNCDICKEMGKVPIVRADGVTAKRNASTTHGHGGVSAAGRLVNLPSLHEPTPHTSHEPYVDPFNPPSISTMDHISISPHPLDQPSRQLLQTQADHHLQRQHHQPHHRHHHHHHHHTAPTAPMGEHQHGATDDYIALDPQIMEDVRNHLGNYIDHDHDTSSAYSIPFQSMLSVSAHSDENHHVRQQGHSGHVHVHHGDDAIPDEHNTDLDMLIEDDDDEHERSPDDDLVDDGENDGNIEETGIDDQEQGQESTKGRTQAQMAARAAEAAMRAGFGGRSDRSRGLYTSGHGFRNG